MLRFLPSGPAARGQVAAFARWRSSASVASVKHDNAETASFPVGWQEAKPFDAIPGPKPLPIIGNTFRFMPKIGEFDGMNIVEVLASFKGKYGPLSKLGGMPGKPDSLVIGDAPLIEQVLRNEGIWPVRKGGDSLEYYIRTIRTNYPVSLATSQGQDWQEFRTAVNQVMMQPRHTKQYVEPIDNVSQEFVDRMRERRDDQLLMPDDFAEEISKWALESITYVALDARLGLLRGEPDPNSEASRMVQAVHTLFDCMYKLDFLPSFWKFVSTPTYREFKGAMDYFTKISTKYVEAAMERLKTTPPSEDQDRNYSVLENLLLKSGDPSKAVAMAMDMLMAGIDTTGTAVATVMYQLANHPEKQRKLQEELDRVIPDPSKPLTKEQLEEMKYLRACIKETIRTKPILLGNARTTVKKTVMAGYQVPEDTNIIMTYSGIFDSEEYFPRAKEFLPERWLHDSEGLKCKHPFAYLPFGFGVRKCVGKRFADLEMETLIAKTFRNFTLEWNRPPAETRFTIILKFAEPLKFTVKDRV